MIGSEWIPMKIYLCFMSIFPSYIRFDSKDELLDFVIDIMDYSPIVKELDTEAKTYKDLDILDLKNEWDEKIDGKQKAEEKVRHLTD